MSRCLQLCLFAICYLLCAAPAPAQTPRQAETFSGTPMIRVPAAIVPAAPIPIDTNIVGRVDFSWSYATNSGCTFLLYYGAAPGSRTNVVTTGTTNSFSLMHTNWAEEYVQHYFVVTAVDQLGHESDDSNEVHSPLHPNTFYALSWTNPAPCLLVGTTNPRLPFSQWSLRVAMAQGMTNFVAAMPSAAMSFTLLRTNRAPDWLDLHVFNPLN